MPRINGRVVLVESEEVPFIHLTEGARAELQVVYCGDIPYEVYSILAALFPEQSTENPIDNKMIGELKTVLKFRQETYSKWAKKLMLENRIFRIERIIASLDDN